MKDKKVLVTGVFDILHEEHVAFLKRAKELGHLIIGIESDIRVQILKGPTRPVNSQDKRKQSIEALGIADEVFILPEQFSSIDDHRALLKKIQPDVLAVSSHTPFLENKRRLMEEFGGEVIVVHKQNPEVSTSIILSRVASKN